MILDPFACLSFLVIYIGCLIIYFITRTEFHG